MHPSRNLVWTRSLLKVGFYLFHWDPNAVKVESYLKQSQNCTKKLILPTVFPLFSLFFLLYPVFHDSHTVYLCTTMACEVEDYAVMFSTKRASLAQSLSEYFIHIHMYWGSQSLFPFMYWVHREELYVSRGRNYDM